MLPLAGDGEIAFYGGSFTALADAVQRAYLDAVRPFLIAGRVAGVRVSTRPDALDARRLEVLVGAGVKTVEIGCQSFDDGVLLASGRGYSRDVCRQAVCACLDAGLQVGIQLLPGLPGGDAAEAMASLDQALGLHPGFLRIYPAVVIAGTELARLWRDGRYRAWSLDEAVEVAADMLTRCRVAEVPVIRLGLQHEPELAASVLAGPYHPAFGQLVRARLWRRLLDVARERGGRRFAVHPADLSDAVGHRRDNLAWLSTNGADFTIVADADLERGQLNVDAGTRLLQLP